MEKMKRVTGSEATVYIGGVCVATTLYDGDGNRAIGAVLSEDIAVRVLRGETVEGRFNVLGRMMAGRYLPIRNIDGDVLAVFFAGQLLTESEKTIRNFIVTDILITLGLIGISIVIIFQVTGYIANPIAKRLEQVHIDGLTGIFNRRYFDENFERIWSGLSRSNGIISLMMCDIDFFKKYNDTYGHQKGDECLKAVARTLKRSIARVDDFVARYGGEEFIIVLPNTDENGARLIVNKIYENIRELAMPHSASEVSNLVTMSIGVITGPVSHDAKGKDFIERADQMAYRAKQSGRNRYMFEYIRDTQDETAEELTSVKQSKLIMETLKETAIAFLTMRACSFEEKMAAGVELAAGIPRIGRIIVWRNERRSDGMYAAQIYRWERGVGASIPEGVVVSYDKCIPSWETALKGGGIVNGPARLMPEREAELLKLSGAVSVAAVPVFIDKKFWGYVLYDDLQTESTFDAGSVEMMRVASFMFANAVIREELQASVKAMEERHNLMLDASPLVCHLIDAQFNVIECNEAAVQLFKATSKKEYMDDYHSFSPPFQPDGKPSFDMFMLHLKKVMDEGGTHVYEWMHQMPDGTPVPCEVTLVQVKLGEECVIAGYTRDLRGYHQMMDGFETKLWELFDDNRAKEETLKRLSRGLHAPLDAVAGALHIVEAQSAAGARDGIEMIMDATRRIADIRDELLALPSRKRDITVYAETAFSLTKLVEGVVQSLAQPMQKKGQRYTQFIDPLLPERVVGDERRITQVLAHLIDNACWYAPEGGEIHFMTFISQEERGVITLRAEVNDNGPGIAKEKLDGIFELFERTSGVLTIKQDSKRAGLPIIKRVVNMMGGTMDVKSELGKGTTFTVIFNVKRMGV
jgi:diguanylate cyclase (GGDEF)-like protein